MQTSYLELLDWFHAWRGGVAWVASFYPSIPVDGVALSLSLSFSPLSLSLSTKFYLALSRHSFALTPLLCMESQWKGLVSLGNKGEPCLEALP